MPFRTVILVVALLVSVNLSAKVSEEEVFSYELSEGGSLSVSNVNGSITVTGSRGNDVEIIATKTADAQDTLDRIEIKISATADIIVIETDLPDSNGWFGINRDEAKVTYKITVPAGTDLEAVETVNGDVEISGVSGKVIAKTVNGDQDCSDLASDARFSTVNGNIDASFATLEGKQKVKAETVNGRVTIRLPEDADTDVSADTLNGSINGRDFGLETEKGFVGSDLSGSIGNGSANLNIDTVNGSVKIHSN